MLEKINNSASSCARWVEAMRPKTWIAAFAPISIGGSLAWHHNLFSSKIFLLTLLFTLAIQIGTNFANDYLDCINGIDRPNRQGPRRLTAAGLISLQAMKIGTMITFGIALFLSTYLSIEGGPFIFILGLISVILGYGYTGGPYPISYNGLGELFAFLFFGPIPTGGIFYLFSHSINASAFIAGIGPGGFAATLLAMNNLRDLNTDKISHKQTLAVRFGKKFAQIEITCLLGITLMSTVIQYFFYENQQIILLPLFLIFPIAILIQKLYSNKFSGNSLFTMVGKLFAAHTMLSLLSYIFLKI